MAVSTAGGAVCGAGWGADDSAGAAVLTGAALIVGAAVDDGLGTTAGCVRIGEGVEEVRANITDPTAIPTSNPTKISRN
ncbi:MAG: hypothetical protein E6I64_11470 [Chloroflexi bacterium]|nr:MAG: hypothetical protein E6I64_11470 [Chloroflexota bacterium]